MLTGTHPKNGGQTGIGIGMTGARAIAQFADGVKDTRGIHLGMRINLVVVGMTAGTIGLIRRERPDIGLNIANMAIITGQRSAMLPRIATARIMTVVGRRPVCRGVAGIAFQRCHKVSVILACGPTTIVTGRTRTRDIGMVKGCRHPGIHTMADVALGHGCKMVSIFAGGGAAVVTIRTGLRDGAMIKGGGQPCIDTMAGVAFGHGCQVVGIFAGGGAAVVASRTGLRDGAMVKVHDRPTGADMAGIASSRGGRVIRRFSIGHHAVVALLTRAQGLAMIDSGNTLPVVAAMAVFTLSAGWNVLKVFASRRNR